MTAFFGFLMMLAAPLLRLGTIGIELLVAVVAVALVFAGFFGYVFLVEPMQRRLGRRSKS